MTIRRKPLYVGVFLVTAGAVMLLAQGDGIDRAAVADALRLWPIAVVAIGVGLLVRHTPAALPAGMIAAAMPGLLLGGVVVAAPAISTDCALATPGTSVTRDGTFAGTASVVLDLACGDVTVHVGSGNGWRVDAGFADGHAPSIDVTGDRLSVSSGGHRRLFGLGRGDTWQVTLPGGNRLDLDTRVNAGEGHLDLAGARLGRLDVEVNAGDSFVDLTGATVERVTMHVNAAAGTIRLPATGILSGDLSANAGKLTVCAPAGLGLRVHGSASLGAINSTGLVHHGDVWESPGYASATSHADLTVSASVGSVDINPEGGCL
jgi:hypothetical protein